MINFTPITSPLPITSFVILTITKLVLTQLNNLTFKLSIHFFLFYPTHSIPIDTENMNE